MCKHRVLQRGNETARSSHREGQEIHPPPPASTRATGQPLTAPLLSWSSGLCTHPVPSPYRYSCTACTPPIPFFAPALQCTGCPLFLEGPRLDDNKE